MGQEFGAPNPPKSGMPVWAWLIVVPCGCMVLIVPILAAILFPVFAQAREKARTASCLSNLKQLGLAVQMYAADYDDHLPAATDWTDMMPPYTANDHVLHCPSAQPAGSETYGYAYNKALSRREQAKVASPETTALLYDSSNLTRNASDAVSSLPNPGRHVRGNNVGYVNGRVKYVRTGSVDDGSGQ